jgi:hypothetical protein
MTKTREQVKEQIVRIMNKIVPVIQSKHFSDNYKERRLYHKLQDKLNNL